MSSHNCPRCDGMMETGFLVDAYGRAIQQCLWAEGEVWAHMLGGKRRLPVTTFRCSECGYLESFATDPASRPAPRREQRGKAAPALPLHETAARNETVRG